MLPCNTLRNNCPISKYIFEGSWITPPPGWVKMNSDASFDFLSNLYFFAAVCRDSDGNLVRVATEGGMARDVMEVNAWGWSWVSRWQRPSNTAV